ncbi:hypothetical protein PP742_gp66 [Alcaligenes phage vB_Af_QDWS595]|uniref:Uncharacterized protein n=1 Tax=Alcaligenes phage vB_Af_QDWS595 TaxID=2877946 RepID=A0AAE8Y379_9CAUD|nr:hypothetical protein PP742_gp66 [Alcaligenes phage vB_Af_QDWS595]UCR75550.1 hypothetical protein vBAfaPQDWS595_66 [Alcaligenes phage vB_Af_QDWS595]
MSNKNFTKPSELLRAAKEIISTPDSWCQNSLAINDKEWGVSSLSPEACAWCSIGCLVKATDGNGASNGDSVYSEAGGYLTSIVSLFANPDNPVDSIAHFNDSHSHERVMELFDMAIEKAEGEGK